MATTACTGAKTPSRSMIDGAVPAKASSAFVKKRIVVKKLKVAEMNPADKQIQDWILSLKKSHEIFREVWAHLWADRLQNPMSVFSEVERLLHAHKNPVDGHFRTRIVQCPRRATEVEFFREGGRRQGKIVGAVFYRILCGANGQASRDRVEVARVVKKAAQADWVFYAEQMPRAAGQSLAFLKQKVTCKMHMDQRERMTSLQCQNLGQNRDSELHVLFSQFDYQRNADTLVQVVGKKFKLLTTALCDNPKFCTRIKVPLNGRIEIFDDEVSQWARDERLRGEQEKERLEEARIAMDKHRQLVEQMHNQAQDAHGTGLKMPGQPGQDIPAGHFDPVVPGQVMNAPPTAEPQFGESVEIPNDQVVGQGQPNDPAAQEPYDPATQQQYDPAVQQQYDPAVQQQYDPAVQSQVDPAVGQEGDQVSGADQGYESADGAPESQPGVQTVGEDGVAHQSVMEFDHSQSSQPGPAPQRTQAQEPVVDTPEEYNARFGQPDPELARESYEPVER